MRKSTPFNENAMLIECDQAAECIGRQLVVDEGDRRAIAVKDAVRGDEIGLLVFHALVGQLLLGFREGAALHQRFRLGENVRHQKLMLMAQLRLEAVGSDHEFGRDDARALMDELVEGVLAVGAGLAPDNRPELPSTGVPSMVTPLPFDSMSSCCR